MATACYLSHGLPQASFGVCVHWLKSHLWHAAPSLASAHQSSTCSLSLQCQLTSSAVLLVRQVCTALTPVTSAAAASHVWEGCEAYCATIWLLGSTRPSLLPLHPTCPAPAVLLARQAMEHLGRGAGNASGPCGLQESLAWESSPSRPARPAR